MGLVRLEWLVVAALACACSPTQLANSDAGNDGATGDAGPDPNDGARSGSRLKLIWYDFADGTRTWAGFYDSQRKEGCYIYTGWADGSSYCVPTTAGGSIAFSNAACTQPIIQVYHDPTCPAPAPTYTVAYQYTSCTSAPAHLYQRGAKTALANYYVQNIDGSCAGPFASPAYYDYYALGPEVATTQLVQLALTAATASTTRLAERFYTSSDGLRYPYAAHDSILGTDCYVESFAAGTAICAPQTNTYAFNFHDAQCTQAVASQPSTCPTPQRIGYYSPHACPNDSPTFYVSGGTIAGSPLYYANGPSTCAATTSSPGTTYYQLGAQLQLASLVRAPDTTPGHRVELVHATGDGITMRDYALYDTTKQTECYPTTAADGTLRCVAASASVTSLYRDAQCTQAIDLVDVTSGPASCGVPTPPKFAAKYLTSGCTFMVEAHPVGAAYAGTAYANYGTCVAYTPNGKLFQVSGAVPATDWESATLATDP